jgi:hypothetical protein
VSFGLDDGCGRHRSPSWDILLEKMLARGVHGLSGVASSELKTKGLGGIVQWRLGNIHVMTDACMAKVLFSVMEASTASLTRTMQISALKIGWQYVIL